MRLSHPAFSKQFLPSQNTARILIGAWPEQSCKHMMAVPDKNPLTVNWQKIAGLSVIAFLQYPLSQETMVRLAKLWRENGALDIFIISQNRPLLVALTNTTQAAVNDLRELMKDVRHG